MKRGQHRPKSKLESITRNKTVYLSASAVAALAVVSILISHQAYANYDLTQVGTGTPMQDAGSPPSPQTNGGIGRGNTVWPQSPSPALPADFQGQGTDANGNVQYAKAKFYVDKLGKLVGPDGSSQPFTNLEFDITQTNTGVAKDNNNGFETINSDMINPDWVRSIDGYQGIGGTTETEFDTLLTNEAKQQYYQWATTYYGSGEFTTYDLPTLITDAGAAFSGVYAKPQYDEGPEFRWTYAPQAKVVVPPQTITGKADEKIYFNDQVVIQTYHANYHYEYVEVDGPNGTPAVPESAIHLQNTVTSSHMVYQTPGDPTSPAMIEVNGGNADPGSISPHWHYWTDGTGETTWSNANISQSQQDYIQLASTLAPGTYTIKLWAADYYNRVTASPATATFMVGSGTSGSGITLTVNGGNTATEPTGTAVNLTATVNTPPPTGHQWQIIIEDNSGSTIGSGRAQASSSFGMPTTFSTTADSQTPLSGEQYTAYLYDATTGTSVPSNAVSASWTNSGGGNGGGGGGLCPAPYISGEQWVNDGGGNQELKWVLNIPTPRYHWVGSGKNRRYVFWYCQDVQTPESKSYPALVGNGGVTGLSYDPGTPLDMWLPTSVQQWSLGAQGPHAFWGPLDQSHGWDGFENGGPDASQVSGSCIIRGQKYFSYGSSAQSPWVWARPDSGMGFRVQWSGSPDAIPESGRVTYTMTNPDGAKRQWSENLVINSDTIYDQGTQFNGLQPPDFAEEYVSAWTQLPKHVIGASGPELVQWSLSSSPKTAFANGAHISVQVQINTKAGTITYNVPNMVALFSYPAWYFNGLKSTTANGQTYTNLTGPAKDGQ